MATLWHLYMSNGMASSSGCLPRAVLTLQGHKHQAQCHWEVVVSPQGDWAKKQPVIQQLHKIMLMVIDDICSGLSSQGVGRTPLTSWRQGWGGGEGWH